MRGRWKRIGRSVLLATAMFAVAFGIYVLTVPDAQAIVIAGPSVCVYYSNGSYQHVVGARGTGCCGEPISWGVTSKFVKCERLYCLDVLCPF